MKKDIILAGVGGQGILSIAASIGLAAVDAGLFLKQAEVHGMSQRGGDVQSNLRLSDKEIASDLIPFGKADMILSVEPMESLRYLPMLASEGWLITNTTTFVNIPNYPGKDALIAEIKNVPNHIMLDAEEIAKETGSSRSANMVMLGALLARNPLVSLDSIKQALDIIIPERNKRFIPANLLALDRGFNFKPA